MEGLVMTSPREADAFDGVYRGATVLVTGHTGFKGSWLCEWLLLLGAKVTGFALPPDTDPALFTQLDLEHRLRHVCGDIRSGDTLRRTVIDTQPDFVFHLAAQPLVRRSYRDPAYTWETNVLGTVHLLDALRDLGKPCAAVMVTSDKCYENHEQHTAYRETDPLGGHDPYSSSKAAAELAIASWRRSFFKGGHPVRIASVRAGNVIGGGDWAEDRIVPDAIRALSSGENVRVRNPAATRPWQHVLEPSSAYLALGASVATHADHERLATAFNVGPGREANQPVSRLVESVLDHWPGSWEHHADSTAGHEAVLLHLDSSRIRDWIGWRPTWQFDEAVGRTVAWYRDMSGAAATNASHRTLDDIRAYEAAAAKLGVPWACGKAGQRESAHA